MTKQIVSIHTTINPDGQYRNRITVDGVTSYGEWADAIYCGSEADTLAWLYRHDHVTRTSDHIAQIHLFNVETR